MLAWAPPVLIANRRNQYLLWQPLHGVNVDVLKPLDFSIFSSNKEFLSFPWIFSSTSLEIFDIILPPLSSCEMREEKIEEVTTAVLTVPRSQVGGAYAPALTQLHPACFKRLKRKFLQHKWGEMMQIQIHAVKHGMFQKPRIKHQCIMMKT